MNGRVLLTAAVLISAVSCGSVSREPVTTAATVRSLTSDTDVAGTVSTPTARSTSTPRPQPTPFVSDAPVCRADQLRAAARVGESALAGGGLWGTITVSNESSVPCAVIGRPVVTLTDGDGTSLPLAPPTQPQPLPVTGALLKPGEGTKISYTWLNWCPPGAKELTSNPIPASGVRFLINLPGGQIVARNERDAAPRCISPGSPSSFMVSAFAAD